VKYNKEFVERLSIGTVDYDEIIVPALRASLESVRGKKILDLGCGNGRYSRLFARLGAQVMGIDKNKNQLDLAIEREHVDRLGIDYKSGDIRSLGIGRDSYDVVLLMFVLVDTSTAAAVKDFISVASEILKRGGLLVIADLHPHNINRHNDIENVTPKGEYSYFDNGAEASSRTWLNDGTAVSFCPNYHYRLDFILNTLAEGGFCLRKFVEPEYRTAFPTHMLVLARNDKTEPH